MGKSKFRTQYFGADKPCRLNNSLLERAATDPPPRRMSNRGGHGCSRFLRILGLCMSTKAQLGRRRRRRGNQFLATYNTLQILEEGIWRT
jgi:hypothetical protein